VQDRSNGYEAVAAEFLQGRGRAPSTAIGTIRVRDWARSLPRGATVVDLGCGSGLPITQVLVSEGLKVYAVDAAPSMAEAFRRNFPEIPLACEPAEDSPLFGQLFEGAIAWGLIFLLTPQRQRRLIRRIADALAPGGRLLFTSPLERAVWNDIMTGRESRSLGGAEYRRCLSSVGLSSVQEYKDKGHNHYFDAVKQGRGIGHGDVY
jgi:SAM-dependent methyltransferase